MNSKFQGKKTIAAGILAILGGATAYFSGEATLSTAALIALNGVVAIVVKTFAGVPVIEGDAA